MVTRDEVGVGTRAWFGLASGVLALAGILALLVGLARTPQLGRLLPPSYFHVALIGHVDLLLVVWYLVVPIFLWRHLGLLGGPRERLAFHLMAAGIAGVTVPSVLGVGSPVLANYIPFLVNPLFLGGLAVFFAGVAVAALQAVAGRPPAPSALTRAAAASAACVLGALAAMLVATLRTVLEGDAFTQVGLVRIFWVGGHLLQFALTALMLTVWGVLAGETGVAGATLDRFLSPVRLLPAGVLAGVAAAAVLPPEAWMGSRFLTLLKSWGIGVPAGLALPLALRLWWEARPGAGGRGRSWRASVGAGILVLAAGGAVALLADLGRQTTLIPGHYHAVLTAVALAFMGLTYFVLDREGVALPRPRWAAWQPYLYGIGTVALVAGMAWAGTHGAPRKTPGAAWTGDPVTLLALNLWGLGALLATAGGGAYLINVAGALLHWSRGERN